ncbi:MAG TPA: hypothetical protein PKN54_07685 [Candidatus Cloacimonas acidaminovorans]|nr:hypothetical protein [Candidatus Cloacimonas acidaminovorans]
MGNGHGGRKVKIVFGSNDNGEIVVELKEIAYPHSSFAKRHKGCGEWVMWEQKVPHRPAQAVFEFLDFCADMGWIDGVDVNRWWVGYWAKDKVYTKDERLSTVKGMFNK